MGSILAYWIQLRMLVKVEKEKHYVLEHLETIDGNFHDQLPNE